MHKELQIFAQIMKIHERILNEVRMKFAQLGLSNTEIMILYHLKHRRREAKASELASDLFLPMSTLTGVIDKMVQRNIVVRERSETDRRVVTIRIHPDFARNAEDHMHLLEQIIKELFSNIHAEWVERFSTDLNYFAEILEKRTAGDDGAHKTGI